MQTLKAQKTTVTPEVVLNPSEQSLLIEGECYPENPLPFFTPIVDALQRHLKESKPASFVANMRLQYVNSASTKGLRTIMAVLNEAGEAGTSIRVLWAHDEEDDALEELGTDLVEDFTFIQMEHRPLGG